MSGVGTAGTVQALQTGLGGSAWVVPGAAGVLGVFIVLLPGFANVAEGDAGGVRVVGLVFLVVAVLGGWVVRRSSAVIDESGTLVVRVFRTRRVDLTALQAVSLSPEGPRTATGEYAFTLQDDEGRTVRLSDRGAWVRKAELWERIRRAVASRRIPLSGVAQQVLDGAQGPLRNVVQERYRNA